MLHQSKVFAQAMARIEKPILDMLENGFFMPPDNFWDGEKGVTGTQIRKLARKVAAEMKRPFVWASKNFHRTWDDAAGEYGPQVFRFGYLSIPKRRYTSPLVAPLQLAAVPFAGHWRMERTPQGNTIQHDHQATYWNYYFTDEAAFDEYLVTMRTRPEMRAALRLPPLPTP